MANTEGMTDERMASLLTSDPPVIKKKRSAFALQQERMRQRLEEPMGERPAATVIRASPRSTNTTNKSVRNISSNSEGEQLDEAQVREEQTPTDSTSNMMAPPIMGAVVERNVSNHASPNTLQGSSKKKSHFASQRHESGFPSLNMPVGTFVKKKNDSTSSKTSSSRNQQEPTTKTRQENSILRDSEALLAQMSPDEIREEVEELKSTLSPEMISFLQKRGKQKAGGKTQPKGTNNDNKTEQGRPKPQIPISETKNDDVKEKERIASLLSSVRTPEELDAVYAQEVGIQSTTAEEGESADSDFDTACNLLRSTSPRQALWAARVVCQRLESDVADGKSFPVDCTNNNSWPYLTVLPVSLRCLLDSPVSQSNGFLLHTYVLRSLYALILLRAHSHHVVNVSCETPDTSTSIFQQYFMDDAVPSPPFGTCYPSISVQPVASTNEGDAVAYSTYSSSTSAQQDGEAFAKDPMWTLLTRMRILPRLAELLLSSKLPDEAIVAICGILAMLSVRSIGTASAIAQHPTILSLLLDATLLPSTDNNLQRHGIFHTRVALPAIIFLCTLARQSRIGTAAIPVNDIVPPIVAVSAETPDEHALQQWSLILWRTVLRYAMGLSTLSTFVSLSISHLASERPTKYSLAVEYLSSFSNVCYCARIASSKPTNELHRLLPEEDCDVLGMATEWLATTARQTIRHVNGMNGATLTEQSDMPVVAARLWFLHSYFLAASAKDGEDSEENNNDSVEWHELVLALQVSERKLLEKALNMIPANGYARSTIDTCDDEWVDVVSEQQEASACAFVDAVASLLHSVSITEFIPSLEYKYRTIISSSMSRFRKAFVDWMNTPTASSISSNTIQRARRGWLNATSFHVNRFVFTASTAGLPEPSISGTDLEIVRSHAFSLIGRLQLGEEAFAAMLFSNDSLFRINGNSTDSTSFLSSFLMQELCATPLSRQQLDHSFKLHYGFGITSKEWGPFQLGTLLSETDSQKARSLGPFAELLLPMGPLWLWKLLSGTVNEAKSEKEANETEILVSCLELLLHLENEKASTANSYAAQVPDGAKLYYLMNVFLHSESVLRDDRISELVISLFHCYTKGTIGLKVAESFWQACLDHSQVSNSKQSNGTNAMDIKDEQLLSVFMGERDVSEKDLRPLIDFVSDVSKAYLEFGAQYDFFTKCIRLFLFAGFPSRVRCEAIRSLREVLHLLTLPEESANPKGLEMQNALNMWCLFSDVGESGERVRDSSEFLDLIVSVMEDDGADTGIGTKWDGSFFLAFAIASLARNLVTSGQDEAFENVRKQRLAHLSKKTTDVVLEAASRLQSDSDADLVSVVCEVINNSSDQKSIY